MQYLAISLPGQKEIKINSIRGYFMLIKNTYQQKTLKIHTEDFKIHTNKKNFKKYIIYLSTSKISYKHNTNFIYVCVCVCGYIYIIYTP